MEFSFFCFGHENVLSLHKNTIEFTKDKMLTKNGDCIIGVNADFDFDALMKFVKKYSGAKVNAEISVNGIKDTFSFFINPDYSDSHEIVIRNGDFSSSRTLGIRADKSAGSIKREIVAIMKNSDSKMHVRFIA